MTEIIIKSKIKSAVKEMSVASDVASALNDKVLQILDEATKRAKANGRRTLQGKDI